jgi:hypothetical protein
LPLATFPDLVRAHYPQLFGSVCARPLAVSDAHALVSRFEELIPEERERERVALRTLIRNEASAVCLKDYDDRGGLHIGRVGGPEAHGTANQLELLTGLLDAVHLFHGKAIILVWERLCLYPALLVQCAAGIAALHRSNFNALANLDLRLFTPVESTHRFPLASLQSRTASWLLERYFAYESTAATAFDRFENFPGMVPMTSIQTSGGGSVATCGGPMGSTGSTLSRTLHGSCKAMAARLLGAGVFNGVTHRLKRAAKTFERFVREQVH